MKIIFHSLFLMLTFSYGTSNLIRIKRQEPVNNVVQESLQTPINAVVVPPENKTVVPPANKAEQTPTNSAVEAVTSLPNNQTEEIRPMKKKPSFLGSIQMAVDKLGDTIEKVTEIVGDVIETIAEAAKNTTLSPKDNAATTIKAIKEVTHEIFHGYDDVWEIISTKDLSDD